MFIINQNGNTIINSDNVISFNLYVHQICAEMKDSNYDIVLMQDSDKDNIIKKWRAFIVALNCNSKLFDFMA